jgi:hypothetical protein
MIKVDIHDLEELATICYWLQYNGSKFNCHLVGKEWIIEITGV